MKDFMLSYIDRIIEKIDFSKVSKIFGEQRSFYTIADDTHAELQLGMTPDGDMWIRIIPDEEYPNSPLRFRMPFIGGARSERMRPLLVLLALGMVQDENEKNMGRKEFPDLPSEEDLALYLDIGEIDYQI